MTNLVKWQPAAYFFRNFLFIFRKTRFCSYHILCYVCVSDSTYRHTLKKQAGEDGADIRSSTHLSVVNHLYSEVIIGHSSQTAANEVI